MYNKKTRTPGDGGLEGAIKTAISLLAYKENTKKELLEKLIDRGYSKEDAAQAVCFTVQKRYLNEERYFMRFVQSSAENKHFGKRRIIQDARRKGFADETIKKCGSDAVRQVDFDDECYKTLCRYNRCPKEKIVPTLLRRGYTSRNVRYALRYYELMNGHVFFSEEDRDPDGEFLDDET